VKDDRETKEKFSGKVLASAVWVAAGEPGTGENAASGKDDGGEKRKLYRAGKNSTPIMWMNCSRTG
jgi:hypothetical protein